MAVDRTGVANAAGCDGTPAFEGQSTAAQPNDGGYAEDFAQSQRLVKQYGARFRHIDELTKEELMELGL